MSFWGGTKEKLASGESAHGLGVSKRGHKDTNNSKHHDNKQPRVTELILDGDEDLVAILIRCFDVDKSDVHSVVIKESMINQLSNTQACSLIDACGDKFKRMDSFEIHFPEGGIKSISRSIVSMIGKLDKLHTLTVTNMDMDVYVQEFITASQQHSVLKNIKVSAAPTEGKKLNKDGKQWDFASRKSFRVGAAASGMYHAAVADVAAPHIKTPQDLYHNAKDEDLDADTLPPGSSSFGEDGKNNDYEGNEGPGDQPRRFSRGRSTMLQGALSNSLHKEEEDNIIAPRRSFTHSGHARTSPSQSPILTSNVAPSGGGGPSLQPLSDDVRRLSENSDHRRMSISSTGGGDPNAPRRSLSSSDKRSAFARESTRLLATTRQQQNPQVENGGRSTHTRSSLARTTQTKNNVLPHEVIHRTDSSTPTKTRKGSADNIEFDAQFPQQQQQQQQQQAAPPNRNRRRESMTMMYKKEIKQREKHHDDDRHTSSGQSSRSHRDSERERDRHRNRDRDRDRDHTKHKSRSGGDTDKRNRRPQRSRRDDDRNSDEEIQWSRTSASSGGRR